MEKQRMGTHILVDMYGADSFILDSMEDFYKFTEHMLYEHGCNVINYQYHKFQPQGFTCVFMLAESHLSIHTWPEKGTAACDIFTCGLVNTEAIAQELIKWISPVEYNLRRIIR